MTRTLIFALMVLLMVPAARAKEQWDQVRGDNFIVYYRDVPQDFAQTVLQSAEEDFHTITENMGITRYQSWHWEKRAQIYIYRDQEDYQKNARQAGWSHGAALVESKTIETFPSAHGFFDSTLPHELGHIILREYVGLNADLPLWFEEGVAMYQEKAKRWGVDKDVAEAVKNGQFIALTDLTNMPLYGDTALEKVQLFYAEGASAVYFLITQMDEAHFYKLLNELKEKTGFDHALKKVYMRIDGTEGLNKAWRQYIDEKYPS